MDAQTEDNQACTLKTPAKGWKMHACTAADPGFPMGGALTH